jgi:UDP-glucuronate 4-epimerase
MKILVTGTAGFIGSHLTKRLLKEGHKVVGIDNINDYYDPNLKLSRLKESNIPVDQVKDGKEVKSKEGDYSFYKINLEDKAAVEQVFTNHKIDAIVNLAAQAGVRYSLTNPQAYIDSNIQGFLNIVEACRHHQVGHLVYASTSSVYGLNEKMPFTVEQSVNHPVSLYAATKKSNEMMAHCYSHLFNIPTTGLRFFTVYGPWGRPDMALFLFTEAILKGEPIKVFNYGEMQRDFTYVEDIVEGVNGIIHHPPKGDEKWDPQNPDPALSSAPYRVLNIGRNEPVRLMDFIEALEEELGIEAKKDMLPIQPGDVAATWASTARLTAITGYQPKVSVKEGIRNFVAWYKDYYKM